jgi:hypothetical protein
MSALTVAATFADAMLCRFGREAVKLYPGITLTARTLLTVGAVQGSANEAVVGAPKILTLQGGELATGDVVKFIQQTTTAASDADCMTGTTAATATVAAAAQQQLIAQLTFAAPTLAGDQLVLCYRSGSEPFRLRSYVTLTVKQLTGVTVRGVPVRPNADSTKQVVAVVSEAPQTVAFAGIGVAIGDWCVAIKYCVV